MYQKVAKSKEASKIQNTTIAAKNESRKIREKREEEQRLKAEHERKKKEEEVRITNVFVRDRSSIRLSVSARPFVCPCPLVHPFVRPSVCT